MLKFRVVFRLKVKKYIACISRLYLIIVMQRTLNCSLHVSVVVYFS